ncbi:MAG: hypothetical protein HC822_16325 [Oscillochloris sp.]|nr:hypothetical protein [Oscillochloris sp.]
MEEQIGSLIFVENPDYPYPFAVPTPPRFWMEETTGALREAIEVYMRAEPLDRQQLDVLKIYVRQFIERALMSDERQRKRFLGRVDTFRNIKDLESLADDLSEVGVEPF